MARLRSLLFLFTHWNWKTALIVGLIRGGTCIAALHHVSLATRQQFGLVEFAYVLATSGFASALQQQSLHVKNRRTGWLLCVVVVPYASLALDSAVHLWANGIGGEQIGLLAVTFTLISAMFHWHVMSKGAMLVGEQSRTLVEDMLAMPRLTFQFVADPVMAAWKTGNALLLRRADEPAEEIAA
jgi:hypothetical protein